MNNAWNTLFFIIAACSKSLANCPIEARYCHVVWEVPTKIFGDSFEEIDPLILVYIWKNRHYKEICEIHTNQTFSSFFTWSFSFGSHMTHCVSRTLHGGVAIKISQKSKEKCMIYNKIGKFMKHISIFWKKEFPYSKEQICRMETYFAFPKKITL